MPPPTIVPKIPPAAAPITALFTLRPVAAPRIAPPIAPMPALCARFGARLCGRGGVAGSSTVGVGRDSATTSPAAELSLVVLSLAVRSTFGDVVSGTLGAGDAAAWLTSALTERVLRLGDVARTDRAAGALATTR